MFFHELFLFQKVIHTFQGKSDQFFDYHESFESIHGKNLAKCESDLDKHVKNFALNTLTTNLFIFNFKTF